MMKIWQCKIGECDEGDLPPAADSLMRQAVELAYYKVTGKDALFLFSGWGAELTESERAVVENRLPAPQPAPVAGRKWKSIPAECEHHYRCLNCGDRLARSTADAPPREDGGDRSPSRNSSATLSTDGGPVEPTAAAKGDETGQPPSTPSELSARDLPFFAENMLEQAFWEIDARVKGYNQWKQTPMSERDAFKGVVRKLLSESFAEGRRAGRATVAEDAARLDWMLGAFHVTDNAWIASFCFDCNTNGLRAAIDKARGAP